MRIVMEDCVTDEHRNTAMISCAEIYTHVTATAMQGIKSPLDRLNVENESGGEIKKILFSLISLIALIGCSKVTMDTIYSEDHNFYAKFPAGYFFEEYQKTNSDGKTYTGSMWAAVVNGCEYSITVTEWEDKKAEERNRISNEEFDKFMLAEYGGSISLDYSNNLPWRKMIIMNEKGIKNSDYTTICVNYGFQDHKHYTLLIFSKNDFSYDNMSVWNSIHFIENN